MQATPEQQKVMLTVVRDAKMLQLPADGGPLGIELL